MVQIDNIELAKSYSQFLAALGGVSITVLTLTLTLRKELADQRRFPFLNAALIAATIVCFIGANGMSEVTAIPTTEMPGVRRLYMIASINVVMAASLFLCALMLLPRVYDDGIPADLKAIAFWSFAAVVIGAQARMMSFIEHLGHPSASAGLFAAAVAALTAWRYSPRVDASTRLRGLSLLAVCRLQRFVTGPVRRDLPVADRPAEETLRSLDVSTSRSTGTIRVVSRGLAPAAVWFALSSATTAEAASVMVDVAADRRSISPLIYGVNWASTRQLRELNSPLNRYGGNSTSRYNWQLNASNRGRDWFYESTPEPDSEPGELADRFIRESLAGGAAPMITVPMLEWVARLGPGRAKLPSFSIAKYGPQQARDDRWFPDAGNGIRADGSLVSGNDPRDAHVRAGPDFQEPWIKLLVANWGTAARGGVPYYILDNEPSLWHANHRDVHPVGASMDELRDRIIDYAARIKRIDPDAKVVAPEEWGWTAYFRSGLDQQWGSEHGWGGRFPDRSMHGDWPYLPWLLRELAEQHRKTGRRLLDVFSVHYYPQGGESSDDVSVAKQQLRARSTRSLWDPRYVDESWIADRVVLIPRLHAWVDNYYPGTAIAITEYDWGAERHISGALAQADVLGIFGREGVTLATRWEAPVVGTPVYLAFQLYRNYDGAGSTFGDVSVRAGVENPDRVAAFAAERSSDGALTVVLLNKSLDRAEHVTVRLRHFSHGDVAHAWQLTAANEVSRLPNMAVAGDRLAFEAPAQSATLLVLSRRPAMLPR